MFDTISWFLKILWTCRISILSGAVGLILFAFALPAQNLMADLSFSSWGAIVFWSGVFLLTILLWALPIHYGARLILDDDAWILSGAQSRFLGAAGAAVRRNLRAKYAGTIRWVPRLLGLVPFFALAIGIGFGAVYNAGTTGLEEGVRTQLLWPRLFVADGCAALLYIALVVARRQWLDQLSFSSWWQLTIEWLPVLCAAATTLIFVFAYFAPLVFSTVFPRALVIPAMFGSLVLPLCLLQRQTHRTGWPFIAPLVIVSLCLTGFNTSFHDLRTVPRSADTDERLTIKDAIARWKEANACSDTACPRPLIVAIDGGASRAAFMGATFVGNLLDNMPASATESATPGRRIFAISGVSGGAYGAAVIQAALADAQDKPGQETIAPCRNADRTWFGYIYQTPGDTHFDWRQCLQALTSGDYLTPTIIGLSFRDFIAVPHLIEDRAVLLEQSWERHYDATVSDSPGFDRFCKDGSGTGLCRHMARVAKFVPPHSKRWIPLLLLNGTSVQTGRRIISSDIAASATHDRLTPLFADAFDLSEAMSSPCQKFAAPLGGLNDESTAHSGGKEATPGRVSANGACENGEPLNNPDIRLSTAALVSARFPLISPAGAFRMPPSSDTSKTVEIGDRVVDGGYFENSGLTTAYEIAQALMGDDPRTGLHPIILSIANEPEKVDEAVKAQDSSKGDGKKTNIPVGLPRRPSTGPLGLVSGNTFVERVVGLVKAPLDTLVATRDGHAAEEERRIRALVGESSFYRIHVAQAPDLTDTADATDLDRDECGAIWDRHEDQAGKNFSMAKLSMSWWLSALVQADLDAQKCSVGNLRRMRCVMDRLQSPPKEDKKKEDCIFAQ